MTEENPSASCTPDGPTLNADASITSRTPEPLSYESPRDRLLRETHDGKGRGGWIQFVVGVVCGIAVMVAGGLLDLHLESAIAPLACP